MLTPTARPVAPQKLRDSDAERVRDEKVRRAERGRCSGRSTGLLSAVAPWEGPRTQIPPDSGRYLYWQKKIPLPYANEKVCRAEQRFAHPGSHLRSFFLKREPSAKPE